MDVKQKYHIAHLQLEVTDVIFQKILKIFVLNVMVQPALT